MAKTRQFVVNDAGDPEPIIVQTYCNRVIVEEDPEQTGWPRDWRFRAPNATDTPRTKPGGTSQVFESSSEATRHQPGDVVGHVETKSGQGATVFNQYEE